MPEKTATSITADLFRFVTVRPPKLLYPSHKPVFFIYHPSIFDSVIFEGTETLDIQKGRAKVKSKAANFMDNYSLTDLFTLRNRIYELALWLARNANTLKKDEMLAYIANYEPLTQQETFRVWDSLFKQLVIKDEPMVRQACIHILKANHLLQVVSNSGVWITAEQLVNSPKSPNPPSTEKKHEYFIQRVCNAKVVVPKLFSVENKKDKRQFSFQEYRTLSVEELQLRKQHVESRANVRISNYEAIRNEADQIISRTNTSSDLPHGLFNNGERFLLSNPGLKNDRQLVSSLLTNRINVVKKKSIRTIDSINRNIKRVGNSKSGIKPYSHIVSVEDVEESPEILMTIHLGYASGYPKNTSLTIKLDETDKVPLGVVEIIDAEITDAVMLRLYPDTDFSLKGTNEFTLNGDIIFNNGDKVKINTNGVIGTSGVHGWGQPFEPLEIDRDLLDIPQEPNHKLFGVNNLGVGIFRRVEQEVCCYVPGEVSRIENVLAREYKERHTRHLIAKETITEELTENEIEQQSDTVSTTRFELQREIANNFSKDTNISTGGSVGVTASYGGSVSVNTNAYFDFATTNASSVSDTNARKYAEDITKSALERLIQKVSQKRTQRILEEFEENNRHGFDNREGEKHVTGVYRWVDIIYTNRLVNYGKRLMLEFLVPEPARYIRLLKDRIKNKENQEQETIAPPVHPKDLEINGPESLDNATYKKAERTYKISIEDPISPKSMSVQKSFIPADDPDADPDPNAKPNNYDFDLTLTGMQDLSKYMATNIRIRYDFDYHLKTGLTRTEDGTFFILRMLNTQIKFDKNNLIDSEGTSRAKAENVKGSTNLAVNLTNLNDPIPLTVEIKNVYNFTIILDIELQVADHVQKSWQEQSYDAIMRAYDEQLDAYYDKLESEEEAIAEKQERREENSNPQKNRLTEQRELKRIAVEMLIGPFNGRMGEDHYGIGNCNEPIVNQTKSWESYASHIKFFEQAIDWELMSYLFYPYYWADRCSWENLMQQEDRNDHIYEGFLQSGMARMVVPVRDNFKEAVEFYLATGDIWNGGGLVVDTDDDLYLSIEDEMEEIEGVVDKEWQTRVPTSLTIVQGKSVYLENEGLPCCNDVEKEKETGLKSSDAILGLTAQNEGDTIIDNNQ